MYFLTGGVYTPYSPCLSTPLRETRVRELVTPVVTQSQQQQQQQQQQSTGRWNTSSYQYWPP